MLFDVSWVHKPVNILALTRVLFFINIIFQKDCQTGRIFFFNQFLLIINQHAASAQNKKMSILTFSYPTRKRSSLGGVLWDSGEEEIHATNSIYSPNVWAANQITANCGQKGDRRLTKRAENCLTAVRSKNSEWNSMKKRRLSLELACLCMSA